MTLAAVALAAVVALAGGEPEELLPDFDQRAPSAISIVSRDTARRTRHLLTFAARVENVGAGPLVLTGSRPSTAVPTMTVEQTVMRSDGSTVTRKVRGRMHYAVENHAHWHLEAFMRYELRNGRTNRLVRPDQKTGFCVGDRYRSRADVPTRPSLPVMTDECGKREPNLLRVASGLSPGWGEIYVPILDAQHIDVTGLAAGLYVLVHRTNADRSLAEHAPANNAASAAVELTYARGVPKVRMLAACEDSARCGAPPDAE